MVEDVIREAIERGDFDNLPGKGKPLNLVQDPLVDPITAIVSRMFGDNDLSHPLLEARKTIVAEAEQCRAALESAWRGQLNWDEAMQTFRTRVKEINRDVRLFNLKAPSPALHGLVIDPDAEIAHICRARPRNRTSALTSK